MFNNHRRDKQHVCKVTCIQYGRVLILKKREKCHRLDSRPNCNHSVIGLQKNEKDVKKDDGIDNDKKSTPTKPEKAEDTKKDDDAKEVSKSEDKKENNKDNLAAEKDGKDDKEKKEVKDDKKDKNKDKSDAEDSEKDENAEDEEEEEEDQEDGQDDDEEVKKGKKNSPKKKGAVKNSKDVSKANFLEQNSQVICFQSKNDNDDEDDETGLELGEIPRIDASISRFKNDDLKMLHKLLYKSPIKTPLLKKNIRKFSGFSFKKSSDEYQKKLTSISSFELKQLRVVCEMLDLEKKGSRDELSERILEFLLEPKDSGKPADGGRPRRSAAVKANNRGYSDEEYSSDERSSPRAKRNAGRRTNLKDETSTEESDEDFQPSDESEEEKPRAKRGRTGRRKKDDSEEEEESEGDSDDSDYSDEGPRAKQRKVANNKTKGRGGATRGRRGRPAASPAKRKAPARRGRKKQESSEDEEESEAHEDASSSEDEPLAKKSAKNPTPPTVS